ncbi:MAG: prepilin peptidase [Clostridia bacterium]|nr:prepilin peptidase [Clostridia bacterium]
MEIAIPILVFIYGLIIGSFLNVCIYRIPRHIFFSSAKSFCTECHHKLAWYDLFPLFSYIFLGGRCRYCKERISPRYPIVEAANAICWLASYFVFKPDYLAAALTAVLSSVLIVVCFIDLDTMEIPNGMIIVILVLALGRFIPSFFSLTDLVWWEYLVGAACVSVPFFIVALVTGGGIGGGDIKLCFAVGLFLGWKLTLLGTLFGVIFGAIASVTLMVKYGKGGKSMIPLAPSLTAGFLLAAFVGKYILAAIFPW